MIDTGKRLRVIMAERNINTNELAKLANLSNATISNLRTGKVKKPNIETANAIAEGLKMRINDIWDSLKY